MGDEKDDDGVKMGSHALAREIQMRRSECGQGEGGIEVCKFVRIVERLRWARPWEVGFF